MSVTEHVFNGKTAIVAITPEGLILNANIENFTIVEDDGYSDDVWEIGDYNRRRDTTWKIAGNMAVLNEKGSVFEIRRNT